VDGKPQFGSYDAILAMFAQTLTEADWKYITAKWDYANTFWPDIAELERQTNGIIPQKLESAPFFVRTADGKDISVKGGYYPLSYASAKLGAGGAVKDEERPRQEDASSARGSLAERILVESASSPDDPMSAAAVALEQEAIPDERGVIKAGRLAGKSMSQAIWILALPVLLQQSCLLFPVEVDPLTISLH
jgi:hypothetical protein